MIILDCVALRAVKNPDGTRWHETLDKRRASGEYGQPVDGRAEMRYRCLLVERWQQPDTDGLRMGCRPD